MFVEIVPLDAKIFGDFSYSGPIHKREIGKEPLRIALFEGANALNISGMGALLNLEIPEEKLVYDCIVDGYEIRGFFNGNPDGTRGSSQRFKVKDQEADAKAYLANRKKKKELEKFVDNLQGKRLTNFGLILGITGSEDMVRQGLSLLLDGSEKDRAKLAKFIYHNDRNILELIYLAKAEGSATTKQGLYKSGHGLFYFNDIPLGLGEDAVIAYLKDAKNVELYQALKDTYMKSNVDDKEETTPPAGSNTPTS